VLACRVRVSLVEVLAHITSRVARAVCAAGNVNKDLGARVRCDLRVCA
jgi:hypothetical protein